MAFLLVTKGAREGKVFPLRPAKTILGREPDCDIVLTSETAGGEVAISRKHAIIMREARACYIEDGDGKGRPSRNGTFVNNLKVPAGGRVLLTDHDTIRIFDWEFEFNDVSSSDDASSIDASIDHSSHLSLAQPAEKLRLLLEITKRLSSTLELESLLPEVVQALLQLFLQADRALLILKDNSSGELHCQSMATRRSQNHGRTGYRSDIVDQCLSTVQGFLSHEPSPALCAPLWRDGGQAFGVLLLESGSPRKRFTEDDLNLLVGVATQASIALSNARYHRQALAQERLKRDLALAREVVRSFLPTSLPELPGYAFFANSEPAYEVGGDYYDFIPLAGGRLGILVGDVSGKGVAAALVMARVSSMAAVCLQSEPDPGAAITRLNSLMHPHLPVGRFVTLVALVLDPGTSTVNVVNAGHPLPLLVRGETGQVEEAIPAEAGGFPLGIMAGSTYLSYPNMLQPGDRLVLFSDGVPEAMDVNDEQLGTKEVRAILERCRGCPRETGECVLQAITTHTAGREQNDDMTLVCVGRITEL
jgi:serine phosphatase RsbU (regulator of sigma subunit)